MKKKKDIFKINGEDVYVKSRVHTWNTRMDDDVLLNWAKMFLKSIKGKKLISRGSHSHYIKSNKPRYCASAGMGVIVLDPKKRDKFFKKKTRRKKKK